MKTYPLGSPSALKLEAQQDPPEPAPGIEWDDLPDADKVTILENDLKAARAYIRGLEKELHQARTDRICLKVKLKEIAELV